MSKANTQLETHGVQWEDVVDLFGYPEPREVQKDGMKTTLKTVGDGGYFVLEGACGTGKTMLALTPLISLVRSNKTPYERIVVVTSVKQQQKAFEDDLKQINDTLPHGEPPVSALSLVGKADINPYSRHGIIEEERIYEKDKTLRENTRQIVEASDNPKSKAKELVNTASNMHAKEDWGEDAPDYPYPAMIPVDANGTEYSPFYAQYIADSFDDSDNAKIPFTVPSQGAMSTEDLVEKTGRAGTDPHAVMGEAMKEVEVVIANYYHIFEPKTVQQFTQDIISDETLLVADEAHNLVPRVRELLCDKVSAVSLPRAQDEIEMLSKFAQVDTQTLARAKGKDLDLDWQRNQLADEVLEEAEFVQGLVDDSSFPAESVEEFIQMADFIDGAINDMDDVTFDKLNEFSDFLSDILDVADREITEKLEEDYGDYWQDAELEEPLEIPLRDPSQPAEDTFTQWASLAQKTKLMSNAGVYGSFVEQCVEHFHDEIKDSETEPTVYSAAVGRLFSQWSSCDHTKYFREIELSPRWDDGTSETGYPWEQEFTVEFKLQNCIPSGKLASRLDEFGGGVFMSATLEPIDVFKETTGISTLEKEGRNVVQTRYGLSFPEANRESLAVNAPAFKYNAKGDAYKWGGSPDTSGVRGTYSDVILSVAKTTPGNVLVCMPSYAEAEWAGDVLEESNEVSKSVLFDESSSNQETEELKQEFFKGDGKIMVTGARGTLVEGVDYDDEKLDSVIVCGVPLENSNSPYQQAIQAAFEYSNEFEGDGFEYAFTIPAVRKARQSIGRAIRSDVDIGTRVLVDERYTDSDRWDSVRQWLPDAEKEEFKTVEPDSTENRLDAFWQFQKQRGEYND